MATPTTPSSRLREPMGFDDYDAAQSRYVIDADA
jgi:hypothetical protein